MSTTTTAGPGAGSAIKTAQDLEWQIDKTMAGVPLLGYMTTWSLYGIEVDHSQLQWLLDSYGFSQHLPAKPRLHKALRRAILRWLQDATAGSLIGGGGGATGGRAVISVEDEEEAEGETNASKSGGGKSGRRGGANSVRLNSSAIVPRIPTRFEHLVVFGVVLQNLDVAGMSVDYKTNLRVQYNRKTDKLIVTQTDNGEIDPDATDKEVLSNHVLQGIKAKIEANWQYYRETLLSRDVAEMVRNIVLSLDGFSTRGLGGVYFVPATRQNELEMLRKLIQTEMGSKNKSQVNAYSIPDMRSTKKQLANAAFDECVSQIEELELEMAEMLKEAEKPATKLQPKTVAKRFDVYKKVRRKSRVYRDLLGLQLEKLEEMLEELEGQAKQVIDRLEASDDDEDEGEAEVEPTAHGGGVIPGQAESGAGGSADAAEAALEWALH